MLAKPFFPLPHLLSMCERLLSRRVGPGSAKPSLASCLNQPTRTACPQRLYSTHTVQHTVTNRFSPKKLTGQHLLSPRQRGIVVSKHKWLSIVRTETYLTSENVNSRGRRFCCQTRCQSCERVSCPWIILDLNRTLRFYEWQLQSLFHCLRLAVSLDEGCILHLTSAVCAYKLAT